MRIIAVASQKGGCGKTTLSGHLAVEAENTGAGPVTLIDTDPQGSLSKWWNAREAESPKFAKVAVFELQNALMHLARTGTQLAIIDTPPAISDSILQVISYADLVVVPTRPSPHDLRAVGETVDMAEKFRKPLVFVINGATPRARITAEAAIALSQHGVVAPVTLHHRVDFAASMVDGRTVGEATPKSASAKEMAELWIYLLDRLARLPPKDETRALPIPVVPVSQHEETSERESGIIIEARVVGEVPATDRFFYDGPERRSGTDRREGPQPDSLLGNVDYNPNAPGRRRDPYDVSDE
jgi:chromosome partitioning protein